MKMMLLMAMFSLVMLGCESMKGGDCCAAGANPYEGSIRHVVIFKFKESATEADIKKVEDAFAALKGQIPQIRDYEWGTNNSPEGLSKGFTHCFLVTFDTEADRDAYLPHPAHKAFVEILKPHLEEPFVIDYEVKLK